MSVLPHPHTEEHAGPDLRLYLMVGVALAGFTLVSFFVNWLVRGNVLTREVGFTLILGVAVVKAVLVTMFFMHVKYDWGKLYFMIVPALILAVMMGVVLLPDIVIGWHQETLPRPVSTSGTR